MRTRSLAPVMLCLVCQEDDGGGGGGPDGGGGGGDAPPIDETPILERTPRIEQTCAIDRDLTILGSNWGGSSMTGTDAGYRLQRLEALPSPVMKVSALELDPTPRVGAELYSLPTPDTTAFVASTSLVAAGDGLAAAWIETGDAGPTVRFVRLDASGGVVAGPTNVATDAGQSGASYPTVKLVAAGDGFGLMWASVRYPA